MEYNKLLCNYHDLIHAFAVNCIVLNYKIVTSLSASVCPWKGSIFFFKRYGLRADLNVSKSKKCVSASSLSCALEVSSVFLGAFIKNMFLDLKQLSFICSVKIKRENAWKIAFYSPKSWPQRIRSKKTPSVLITSFTYIWLSGSLKFPRAAANPWNKSKRLWPLLSPKLFLSTW